MDVQIKKWGNSIGLRIPYKIAETLGLNEDSIVELTITEDLLTIRPKAEPKPLTLTELLASIPDDFQYPEDVADFVQSEALGQEQL
jgi:antitoxin MazE